MSIWNEKNVIESLILHFGDEFRDEIEDSLNLDNGEYSEYGKSGEFTVGGEGYNIIKDEEEAEEIAELVVYEELKDDPYIAGMNFIRDFVYIDDVQRWKYSEDEAYAFVEDLDDDEVFYKLGGLFDIDSIEEAREQLLRLKFKEVSSLLKDPFDYFINYKGFDFYDILKMSIIRIDYGEAAEASIKQYGWSNFISKYDGNYEEIDNGFIIFRN